MKTILYARVSTTDQTIAHQWSQSRGGGLQVRHCHRLVIPIDGAPDSEMIPPPVTE